ncbi:MAG TPA: hypothetical protein VH042_08125 [Solirubrobacterales bacterium]|nr:hypothetical protein [Solirubrobacterales bacterium]
MIVAGCGGGGSSDETSPSSSKAAYVKSADAICTKTGKEVKAQYAAYLKKNDIEEGASKESPAEMKAHVIGAMETVAIPAFNKQIEKLKALEAPSELKAKTEEFIAAVEAAVEKGEAEPLLIFAKEPELFVKSDKVAKELGFRVCGNH